MNREDERYDGFDCRPHSDPQNPIQAPAYLKVLIDKKKEGLTMDKLPSRFQPGDLVVYHVFGGDKWISGCVVKRVGFTDNGKVIYNLHVPVEFEGRDPIYCPVNDVPSEWVVSRIGEKNPTVLVKDELRIKTTNEG